MNSLWRRSLRRPGALFLASLGVMVGVAYMPGPGSERAAKALEPLWQVAATVLTLSIVLMVFALEAVRRKQFFVSLSDFATRSGLAGLFSLGMAAIVLMGLVDLGVGRHAGTDPDHWAAIWSAAVAGLAIALLPVVLVRVVRRSDPDRALDLQLETLDDLIDAHVRRDVFVQLAFIELSKAEHADYKVAWPFSADAAGILIPAPRAGRIRDISMRRLRLLGRLAARRGLGRPRVLAPLGLLVQPGDGLLALPEGASRSMRWLARRVVRLGATRGRSLAARDVARIMDEEAHDALGSHAAGAYRTVLRVYEHVLLQYAAAWPRYGLSYDRAIAGDLRVAGFDFLWQVETDLERQFDHVARAESREIAYRAARLAPDVLPQAYEQRAEGLTHRMLFLALRRYEATQVQPPPPRAADVWSTSFDGIMSFGEGRLRRDVFELKVPTSERETRTRFMVQVVDGLRELLRAMTEQGDVDGLRDVEGRWRLLAHPPLPPDEESRSVRMRLDWSIQSQGEESPGAEALKRQLAELISFEETERRLVELIAQGRFLLAAWAVRRARREGWSEDAARSLRYWSEGFPHLAGLMDAAASTIDVAGRDESNVWFRWMLDAGAAPRGRSADLLDGLALLAIACTEPAADLSLSDDAARWLTDHQEGLRAGLTWAAGEPLWESALPHSEVSRRADNVWRIARQAVEAEERRRITALRQADIDPARRRRFEDAVREGWSAARILMIAARASDAARRAATPDHRPPALPGRASDLVRRLLRRTLDVGAGGDAAPQTERRRVFVDPQGWRPKREFLESPAAPGNADVGKTIGGQLAIREDRALLAELLSTPTAVPAGPSLAAAVRAALAHLRDSGYRPDVVLMPLDPPLLRKLSLEPRNTEGLWGASELGQDNVGTLDGAHVVTSPEMPSGRIVVAELARAIRADRQLEPEVRFELYRGPRARLEAHLQYRARGRRYPSSAEIEARARQVEELVRIRASLEADVALADADAVQVLTY